MRLCYQQEVLIKEVPITGITLLNSLGLRGWQVGQLPQAPRLKGTAIDSMSSSASKTRSLGPVYTLKVAGERMTFLTDAKDFHNFFQSTDVDFQKAVQSSVQKIASVTEEAFFKNHTKIHDTVKGRLSFHKLPPFCETLHSKFKEHLVGIKNQITIKNGCEFEAELNDLVRSTMYKSIMDNLFGDGVLPTHDEAAFKEFEKNFLIFDEQFEYAARLPKIFLREWTKSKNWLLQMFTRVTKQCMQTIPADVESRSLLQTLIAVIDDDFSPNWSMMMLWASLANAIPITFWTLCMIYQHQRVLEKVQSEVRQVLKENEKCDESTLALMPYTRQCILEAIRLRSPGIFTRRVIKEFRVKGYNIPVGDLLMVSPFWAHRNSQQFPDPEEFKPERWENIEKNSFPESFIAFGGGRYQCPGRWFALLEMHIYVSLFVSLFDCKLLNGVPDLCELHLVGTQQPVQKCPVVLSLAK
ncbi:24-hydroxycholesterol 7-alpha-hydroxylase-like isoform X2 [Biomphalaria glabrata]|uniref:24-hydroxycholesterol 7-alpha-hydroxylase-like isoform X2 n=1 Tax=Biomphalaria glabrata TaxID=6526 RepID=A0A9U8EFA5_BIOGL|nr:24-hydroxycholesterol 7-alpha-hydroxylase-like isoform X2 [Biomphalaria glabrata]